ncbi:kinase-like domain-containing protein, partial [Cyathus striatus]
LLDVLGKGRFGTTYRAIDNNSQSFCAIKVQPKPIPKSEKYILLKREVRHLKEAAGHPNIVAFRDYEEDNQYTYLVMDLIVGRSLYTSIEADDFKQNDQLIKHVFIQILDGVQHLHSLDIFHGDIKLHNIMVASDWTVKIIDFGVATNQRISPCDYGTVSYRCPESYTSKSCDSAAADTWALGQILIEMISLNYCLWKEAKCEDEGYKFYLSHRASRVYYFHENLPISKEVAILLYFVLNPEPRQRLDIVRFREYVAK